MSLKSIKNFKLLVKYYIISLHSPYSQNTKRSEYVIQWLNPITCYLLFEKNIYIYITRLLRPSLPKLSFNLVRNLVFSFLTISKE